MAPGLFEPVLRGSSSPIILQVTIAVEKEPMRYASVMNKAMFRYCSTSLDASFRCYMNFEIDFYTTDFLTAAKAYLSCLRNASTNCASINGYGEMVSVILYSVLFGKKQCLIQ